jgi:hypothetical protein
LGGLTWQNYILKQLVATRYRRPIVPIEIGDTLPDRIIGEIHAGLAPAVGANVINEPGVIAVLSTTCQDCDDSLPAWKRIAAARRSPLHTVALVFGTPDQVREYRGLHDLKFPTYPAQQFDPDNAIGINRVPTVLIHDSAGVVVYKRLGVFDDHELRRAIDRFASGR